MTKEEFEKEYCQKSQITIMEYEENFVTLPCECIQHDCKGWACINKDTRSIKTHNELYN